MDIILTVAILIVPVMATIMIIKNYHKCNNIMNQNNVSGMEVAHRILENNKLDDMYVVEIPGTLKDHYDINRKVIRLSKETFNKNTVSSLVLASQVSAHAIQDKEGYGYLKFRDIIQPIAKVLCAFSYVAIILGLIVYRYDILDIATAILSIVLIFQLMTLPVEFSATKIAIKELKKAKLLDKKEEDMVFRLLRTISFIYVASILTSIVDVARYITSLITDRR